MIWRKSSYSSGEGQCIEVTEQPTFIAARDSKTPDGPVLRFGREGWASFIEGLARGKIRE